MVARAECGEDIKCGFGYSLMVDVLMYWMWNVINQGGLHVLG